MTIAAVLLGAMAAVGGGAVAWGALMPELTMFHAFYGAITVFATPAAAAAIVIVWAWFAERKRRGVALAIIVVAVLQLEVGVLNSWRSLLSAGPHTYPPIPTDVLAAIAGLDANEKVGYACLPAEEIIFWDPALGAIDMHTGRRIVPLCYQSNAFSMLMGGTEEGASRMASQFQHAPQVGLFPTADAQPSPDEVAAFMRRLGIGYLYVDDTHPNTLVPDAVPVFSNGTTQLLRLP